MTKITNIYRNGRKIDIKPFNICCHEDSTNLWFINHEAKGQLLQKATTNM
jgi:hypothetical protein